MYAAIVQEQAVRIPLTASHYRSLRKFINRYAINQIGKTMVNYGIVEVGIFFILIGILSYYSLPLPMIVSAAIGGLGLLVGLVGLIWKQPADKKKKRGK